MRILLAGTLLSLCLAPSLQARDAYQVHQENKSNDAWREKAFFNNSSSSSSSSRSSNFYTPPPKSNYDASAAAAANRYRREQQRADDEYNARVARHNAEVDALNAVYAERKRLMDGAQAGNVPSMRLLALHLFSRSETTPRERGYAVSWMEEAARQGDAEAKRWVAERAAAEASRRAAVAAAANAAEAQRVEAARVKEAEAAAANLRQAIAEAEAGDVHSMNWAARLLYIKSDPASARAAFQWFHQAAQLGDEQSMEMLRIMTNDGGVTPEDRAVAVEVRDQLARLPKQEAAYLEAGDMHLTGKFGAEINRELAIPPLVKAAEAGNTESLYRIAVAFAKGFGGPRDVREAIAWYKKAIAQKGNNLGDSAERGRLEMSLLMLEPANEPAQHADEILALWDEGVLGWGEKADQLSLLAREALASGQLGRSDPVREIYYLSRALRAPIWTDDAELLKTTEFYANYLSDHLGNANQPVPIIRKAKVTRTATSDDGLRQREYEVDEYTKVVAQLTDIVEPLVFLAQKSPSVKAYIAAASFAVTIPPDTLKEANLPADTAYQMFDECAQKFDDPVAWLGSGCLLLNGWGVSESYGGALARLTTAWEKGSAKAALYLAIMNQRRLIADASDARAQEWIRLGAEKSDPACMAHHGTYLLAQDDAGVHPAGLKFLEQAAGAGDVGAMTDLAGIYESGTLAPKNEAKSLELLRTAVAANSARGKAALADRLAQGRGVEKNQKEAMRLLREAASNDRAAAGNLGVVLWRGDWGEKNIEDGLSWMEGALEAGNWPSGRNLAKIHHLGLGVEADEAKARGYLEKAGEIGGAEAAHAVSEFYAKGEIITKDPEAAERWADRATSLSSGG